MDTRQLVAYNYMFKKKVLCLWFKRCVGWFIPIVHLMPSGYQKLLLHLFLFFLYFTCRIYSLLRHHTFKPSS